METKAALEDEPTTSKVYIPPSGEESYNQIEVKLGIEDDALCLELVTPGDEPAVQLEGSALELKIYCPRTTFFISPPADSIFVCAAPPTGTFLPASEEPSLYAASIDLDGVLSIQANNYYRVSDPYSGIKEEAATAGLEASDSSGRSIAITLVAPPYRLVEVEFDADATPQITYGLDSDFSSVDGESPEIGMPQDGGIVFTLVSQQEGARFADPPFDPLPPDWIIDVGTDGQHAFMADLHPDTGSEYGFRIRVSYGGRDWESEDPTIVNVDPSGG